MSTAPWHFPQFFFTDTILQTPSTTQYLHIRHQVDISEHVALFPFSFVNFLPPKLPLITLPKQTYILDVATVPLMEGFEYSEQTQKNNFQLPKTLTQCGRRRRESARQLLFARLKFS